MNKFLTLLENPIIVICLTVIILAIIIKNPLLIGRLFRKWFRLNTDDETVKFSNKVEDLKTKRMQTNQEKHNLLKEFKQSNLIGGRPDDR